MRHTTIIRIAALAGMAAIAGCGGGGGTGGGAPPIGTRKPQITAPGAVTFDPTGKFAYVMETTQPKIAQFTVNSDGSVTPLSPATVSSGINSPFASALAHTASGSFLYINASNLNHYKIAAGGALTPLNPPSVPIQGQSLSGVTVDPTNHFVYVADAGAGGGVNEFRINADGTLTSIGFLSIGALSQIVISPDGKWMFTNNMVGSIRIHVLKVNADGTLSLSGSAGTSPVSLFATHPNLPVLYAAEQINSSQAGQLDAFTINGDGTLTPLGQPVPIPLVLNNNPLAISPNGKAIYIPDPQGADVAQVRINADGSLSAMNAPTVTADGPTTAVAITPDGTHLFASAPAVVNTYQINADGTLTAL